MKKIKGLIVLLFLATLPLLSISQTGYPKLIVWQGDTLIAITRSQQKAINLVKVERDYYSEFSDSLVSVLNQSEIVILESKELIDHLEQSLNNKDLLNTEYKKSVKELKEKLIDQGLKLQRQKSLLLITGSVSVLELIILLAILL